MSTEQSHRTLAIGRLKPGIQNRTEAEYASVLESRKIAGEIAWYAFEGVTLKLAAEMSMSSE